MRQDIQEAVEFMQELIEEGEVPRNVRSKIINIIDQLKKAENSDISLTVNKLLSDLDDISSDVNLDSFTRQQIWSISSLLEAIDA